MEDNNAVLFRNFIDNLKRLYGEYYLVKMTREEKEKYIIFYSKVFQKDLVEARKHVNYLIRIKKRSYAFAKFESYKKSLLERYGEFYFIYMTFEERKKLVEYYYKALKESGYKVTSDEAFWDLYDKEHQKYEDRMKEYQNNLERLEFTFSNRKI